MCPRCGAFTLSWYGRNRETHCVVCFDPPLDWEESFAVGRSNPRVAIAEFCHSIRGDSRAAGRPWEYGTLPRATSGDNFIPRSKQPKLKCYFKRSLRRTPNSLSVEEKSVKEVFSCLSVE